MSKQLLVWAIAFGLAGALVAQEGDDVKLLRLRGEVFRLLELKPGNTVADIGAGEEGMWSIPLSQHVGNAGAVLAEDIDLRAIEKLRKLISDRSIDNVQVITGSQSDPHLPTGQLDSILVALTYHEFTEHVAMLSKLHKALKPGGRLVIFESIAAKRRKGLRTVQTKEHEISPEFVEAELREAGFTILERVDPLWPDQEAARYLIGAQK